MFAIVPLAALATALALGGVATVPTEPEGAAGSGFEQSLGQLPANALDADGAVLLYVNMGLAWERIGAGTDVAEREEQLGALPTIPNWTQVAQLFGSRFFQLEESRAEVGFTVLDIEREITVQAPPRNVTVAETSVDPEQVVAALESDPMWSEELTRVEHPNGGYFQWGDDPLATNVDRLSPLRPLGQGGELAIVGGDSAATVVRTLDPADVEAVLDTLAGVEPSLLDTPLFEAALPAVGDADVLQAVAVDAPTSFDPAALVLSPEAIEAVLAQTVFLQPYAGTVIVETYDGEESTTEVLLVHTDEAGAAANAALVEQALAENVDLQSNRPLAELLPGAAVSTVGSVVVVTLPFEGAYPRAQQMLFQRALFPTG